MGAVLANLFKMKVASFRVLTPWFPTHQGSSGVIVVEVHGLTSFLSHPSEPAYFQKLNCGS